ncbi:flagellar basal body P-ring formation chaperone FlgA [Rhodocaloribacter litoris]|uniref:flagellar basal body P-ring formation chaperone FlgA n=1 Tax=Rhodocaloribacter litoris TaxID=2558931 RepID=UPI00141EBEB0|nr:flagellar basal body P-ring formation chaperone FlgA [Rhodocaloribacter litoris]QXD16014.1 flagellar basal body P-ring formation chaperone FlgA [Rhodocaloribacter litoris]
MYGLFLTILLLLGPMPGQVAAGEPDTLRERLQAAAETLLADRFPEDAPRLRVRVLRTGGEIDPEAALRLRLPAGDGLPRAHIQVDVLGTENGQGGLKTGWALLYIAHFDSVVVARHDLEAGAPVTPGDVSTAWMEVTRFRGEPLRARDFRALARDGAFAARMLRAGRALRKDDLRPPLAADTGEAVLMHYRRGSISLRLTCKAREPGLVGDIIRLYFPDAEVTYRARLTGPGTAEWIETL